MNIKTLWRTPAKLTPVERAERNQWLRESKLKEAQLMQVFREIMRGSR